MKDEIDAKTRKFVDGVLSGLTNAEAYRKAGFKASTSGSASVSANRLLKKAKVRDYRAEQERLAKERNKVTMDERLEVLSNVIRDPEFMIHPHALKAIEIMNKMEGVGNPEAEAIGNLAEALAGLGSGPIDEKM